MQKLTTIISKLGKLQFGASRRIPGKAQDSTGQPLGWAHLRLKPQLTGLALVLVAIFHSGSAAFSAPLPGGSLKLAWHTNPESNIAGYEVKYGTASGQYSMKLDAGLQTRVSLSDLTEGETYYIVVTAYNLAGMKSAPSEEVVYRVRKPDANSEPRGTIQTPSTDGTIFAGQKVEFSGDGSDPNGNTPLTYHWNFGEGSGIADSQERNPGAVRFEIPGTYQVTLTVKDSKGQKDPTPAARTIRVISSVSMTEIPRDGWRLKYVDSEETLGYAAVRSFDGDSGTFWHTKFRSGNLTAPSHQIQINLGSVHAVSGFGYLPRQDGFTVGNIGKYEFYVSMDGQFWGKPVATGTFVSSPIEKQVVFEPKAGRFIRLVSRKEVNGNTDSSIAELRLFEAPLPNRSPSSAGSAAPLSAAVPGMATPGLTLPANSSRITTAEVDGLKYLMLTVAKPAVPDDLKRLVQVSPNLVDWFSGSDHTTVIADNESFLRVRDNTPIAPGAKRFIRLKTSRR